MIFPGGAHPGRTCVPLHTYAPFSGEDSGNYRCFEQILRIGCLVRCWFGSVIVSVLAGIEKRRQGPQGGLGDLGEDGGLPAGLVPQDLQVEGGEQAGFEAGSRPGRMSPARGSSSSRVGSAAFGVAAWRASSWAWACSRSANRSPQPRSRAPN